MRRIKHKKKLTLDDSIVGEVNPRYVCLVGVKKGTAEYPFKSAQCHAQAFGNKYTFI